MDSGGRNWRSAAGAGKRERRVGEEEEMNTRVRTAVQGMRAPPKHVKEMEKEKKKTEVQGSRLMDARRGLNRCQSRRERKIALQQDVDKLKKKLRDEENLHRALERAFTRPLGALPRLPPYLPSYTLELLAEVAVLEEEVVRLEEQVVNFRQGLYQEAIYISSSKKTKESASDSYCDPNQCQNSKTIEQAKNCAHSATSETANISKTSVTMRWSSDADSDGPSSNQFVNGERTPKKPNSRLALLENRHGKENQLNTNAAGNCKQSPVKRVSKMRMLAPLEKRPDAKAGCQEMSRGVEESFCGASDEATSDESGSPNKLSEDVLTCLISIFSRMSSPKNTVEEQEMSPCVSGSSESSEDAGFRDPYGICLEFGRRDIGPYKHCRAAEASSIDPNVVTGAPLLTRRLKLLLRKLAFVDLSGLTHQQKLAFWINIYNSCMMNAFLEQGIPTSPQMVVSLMSKAMINVGGRLFSAMAIEHFILRLPYHPIHAYPKGSKSDDMNARGLFGLEWPEPLVTFALSCGSWSSPAVRVYTASQVENELEIAKRDYLQAAVGVCAPNKLAIPKLLDWYLLDFAKDVGSLMDWICLQLPSELRNDAVKCLEMGRSVIPQPIQVLPYEFKFRYLLAPLKPLFVSSIIPCGPPNSMH
ncbi:uncharacterized protein LOC103712010 isoform X2 [Phoenix dactylifera]|uniref:Uncharacterized protein LOC103712010 isoform X2 n=1 Tax=Phoenix dactylifera TaxID=42345 RepID=A0A8B9ATI2_PHODC|nr:uncharacterized protein LOC103712010 isoform X2 [Phoenix dactylifera]